MMLVHMVQTIIPVTSTSIQLIAADASRKYLKWLVIGANSVTIGIGDTPVVYGNGIIYGSGGALTQGGSETFDTIVPINSFQVICSAGQTSTIVVWAGY